MAKRKTENVVAEPAKKVRKQEPEELMSAEEISSGSESELGSDASSADELDELDELDDLSSDGSGNGSDASDNDSDNDGSDDEKDDFGGFEDEDEEQENGEENGEEPSKNSQLTDAEKAEKRLEQKKLRQDRKLKKAFGQEIESLKKVWEHLRDKSISASKRKEYVQEAFELAKDQIPDLVFRHDSTRVVQTLFKYADQEKRLAITNALKGKYVELAKSSYGKYLLVKMLFYGSAKTRKQILDELHGHFRQLMKHREGAYVIEDAFREYATAAQKRQILREFYGSEFAVLKTAGEDKPNLAAIIEEKPEKKPYLLDNLNQVITSAVNKGSIGFEIIHAAMLEYARNIGLEGSERETFVDLITEQFAEIVHTNAGSQVANLVLAFANAKERKKLVKALKAYGDKLATDQYGNQVLTTIFNTVDDTVYVNKSFAPIYEDHMAEFMRDKFARRPFLYLLMGRAPKYFARDVLTRLEEVDKLKATTSKKDDETRRLDLLKLVLPTMYQAVIDHAGELVRDPLGMQFLGELFTHDAETSAEAGLDEQRQQAIDAVVSAFDGNPTLVKNHPLTNPVCGRVLKQLVREVPAFQTAIAELVAKHALEWATGNGTFVAVALLESLEDPKPLKSKLKAHKKEIKASDAKGSKLLVELL